MTAKSRVTKSSSTSKSLRVTIPKEIVNTLDLNANDELNWIVNVVDNQMVVSIKK
jgi:bifunctional DNA-binding transcriptional regulator/antitoxin component of YhaV-PrlF toxin-antitoxin module